MTFGGDTRDTSDLGIPSRQEERPRQELREPPDDAGPGNKTAEPCTDVRDRREAVRRRPPDARWPATPSARGATVPWHKSDVCDPLNDGWGGRRIQ